MTANTVKPYEEMTAPLIAWIENRQRGDQLEQFLTNALSLLKEKKLRGESLSIYLNDEFFNTQVANKQQMQLVLEVLKEKIAAEFSVAEGWISEIVLLKSQVSPIGNDMLLYRDDLHAQVEKEYSFLYEYLIKLIDVFERHVTSKSGDVILTKKQKKLYVNKLSIHFDKVLFDALREAFEVNYELDIIESEVKNTPLAKPLSDVHLVKQKQSVKIADSVAKKVSNPSNLDEKDFIMLQPDPPTDKFVEIDLGSPKTKLKNTHRIGFRNKQVSKKRTEHYVIKNHRSKHHNEKIKQPWFVMLLLMSMQFTGLKQKLYRRAAHRWNLMPKWIKFMFGTGVFLLGAGMITVAFFIPPIWLAIIPGAAKTIHIAAGCGIFGLMLGGTNYLTREDKELAGLFQSESDTKTTAGFMACGDGARDGKVANHSASLFGHGKEYNDRLTAELEKAAREDLGAPNLFTK